MSALRWFACPLMLAVTSLLPANASTFAQVDLEHLTDVSSTIVIGEVVEARSRWNDSHDFILTDFGVVAHDYVKGKGSVGSVVTVTLLGGKVGDLSTLIVDGASLQVGKRYVLFLDRVQLMRDENALTVPEHRQGVFELEAIDGRVHARSQAASLRLAPNLRGETMPPGGAKGIPLDAFIANVRQHAARRTTR